MKLGLGWGCRCDISQLLLDDLLFVRRFCDVVNLILAGSGWVLVMNLDKTRWNSASSKSTHAIKNPVKSCKRKR